MTPLLLVFMVLQSLDFLTTLMGLRMGAVESSTFIGAAMLRFGPVTGLVVSKVIASLILIAAVMLGRSRLILFTNWWFTGIVGWNLLILGRVAWHA
jgi:hypothetical protein